MKISTLTLISSAMTAAAIGAATVALPPTARADGPPPCSDGQVQVANRGEHRASGHRQVILGFSLTPGAQPCTLTGYPGVDSGAGGPLVHATRATTGFFGNTTADPLPTFTLTAERGAHASVEGVAADRNDPNRLCPTYTELEVTPPDTTESFTIGVGIDTCELNVLPMGTPAADDTFGDHSETAQYTIDITYPRDYPDEKSVSDFVNADRGYFLDWIARNGNHEPDRQYTYDVRGKTYSSTQPATTSLVLTLENNTGAAHEGHPTTVYESFNYDLTNQRPITYETLFKPDADVVSVLGPKVAKLYDRPTKLLRSDFRNFALTDDAVIFFFGEGQLMPADNTGPRQISVPRSELAPLLA
jgi:hypothetical protein